ncbi:hypothetical protein BG011_005688 [Mortierella polycephala]|uniref:FAD-binding domain-containing protein n=1 Tax=Mortierella polycephala TaxID=41804 RepID=A0A9P6QGJ7_9FUNG|nr:hypothetical protein BG011_005688 [Mortierella polycephala]
MATSDTTVAAAAATPAATATNSLKPKVLIVGAGIAGLTMAILLHKADIPFEIFERTSTIKALGSALTLGVNIIPLFKQMGIYDDFVAEGKPFREILAFNEQQELIISMDMKPLVEMGGDEGYVISRPDLQGLLMRHVPAERVHMGQRVESIQQDEHGVKIIFADGTSHQGDILVGADGAHSVVRKDLYQQLKEDKKLPASDEEPMPFNYTCLVGQTRPLDPEEYPQVTDPLSQFNSILGENYYTWATFTTKNNTICWMVAYYIPNQSNGTKNNNDSNNHCESDWGPDAAQAMCNKVRDFVMPSVTKTSKTMGDLIDQTPKELVSKVVLEEKVFDTWHAGRTVLIGDACHKFTPAGGQGAINAIQDTVALANWIHALPSMSLQDIDHAFQEYKAERYPNSVAAYNNGQMLEKCTEKSFLGAVARVVMKHMPRWLLMMELRIMAKHRPQVAFLPLIEDQGTVKPAYQASLHKTRRA